MSALMLRSKSVSFLNSRNSIEFQLRYIPLTYSFDDFTGTWWFIRICIDEQELFS